MAPGTRRSWTRYLVVIASAGVMVPVMDALGRSATTTWLGVATLVILSGWLFHHRRKLRTSFFLPLLYAPALVAFHFSAGVGIDAPQFTVALLLLIVVAVVAALTDAFWRPYQDDLDDLSHVSESKE